MSSDQLIHPEFQPPKSDPLGFSAEASSDIPSRYGDNRLTVLPRDPQWIFAYWDLTAERIDELNRAHSMDVRSSGALMLRVFSAGEKPESDAVLLDVSVSLEAWSTYVRLPEAGLRCRLELGIRLPDGQFISILSSNRIRLPRGKISKKTDSRWMRVGHELATDEWSRLFDSPTGGNPTSGPSSSGDISRRMAQRWEFLISLHGSLSSAILPSSLPSSRQSAPAPEEAPHE